MRLSVVISTSPGRQHNLMGCLNMLSQQSYPADEIWVSEDGRSDCEAAVKHWNNLLPVHYISRPRDFSVARSRNLGAAKSQGHYLVFIDCDILLQPRALEAYLRHFHDFPNCAVYGYVGHQVSWWAPSLWLTETQVYAQDLRFLYQEQFYILPKLWHQPQLFAWSGNFALPRSLFESIGGFDPKFIGPGWEDVDLGNRLVKAGIPLLFSRDAWAEHQLHPPAFQAPLQKAHNRAQIGPLWPAKHPPLIPEPSELSGLEQALKQHYLPLQQPLAQETCFEPPRQGGEAKAVAFRACHSDGVNNCSESA